MRTTRVGAKWAHCVLGSDGPGSCSPTVGGTVARRVLAAALIVPALVVALAACTSSGGDDPTTSASSPSSVTSSGAQTGTSSTAPSSTAPTTASSSVATPPPQTKAALAAYTAFTNATNEAQRTPSRVSKQLAQYAIDPALGTARGVLTQFQVSNIEWHGTPPASRTRVVRNNPTAQPYPTVTLIDCPTLSSTWRPYNTKTGKPVKTVTPKVAPPWATTATIALYKGKWMVQIEKTDMTRTCTP